MKLFLKSLCHTSHVMLFTYVYLYRALTKSHRLEESVILSDLCNRTIILLTKCHLLRSFKARALSNFNPCSFVLWNVLLNLTNFNNKSFVQAFKLCLPQTSVNNASFFPRLQLLKRFFFQRFCCTKGFLTTETLTSLST